MTISNISLIPTDPQKAYDSMMEIIVSKEAKEMTILWQQILEMMRKEIGNN